VKKAGKGTQGIRDKEAFKAAVCEWSVRLKVTPSQVRMQKMQNKWASCSAKKWVSFSDAALAGAEPREAFQKSDISLCA
jgi:predicted metal-dependent hydrolase